MKINFNKSILLAIFVCLLAVSSTECGEKGKDQARGYTTWRDDMPGTKIDIKGDKYFNEAFIKIEVSKAARQLYPNRIWKVELRGAGIETLQPINNQSYFSFIFPRTKFFTGDPISDENRKYMIVRELHDADFTPGSQKCIYSVRVTVYKNMIDYTNNIPENVNIYSGQVPNETGSFQNTASVCRNVNKLFALNYIGMKHPTGLGYVGLKYTVNVKNGRLILDRSRE